MKKSTFALMLACGAAVAVVVILVINQIQAHPQIGLAILIALGVVALVGFVYVLYILVNRIHENHHRISTRKLAYQAEIDRQDRERLQAERSWQVEQQRLMWEQERNRQAWVLEQQRLQLEDQKIKLAAYQAQAVQVKHDQALIIRDYSGLESRVAYQPQPRVQVREDWRDTELVSEPEIDGLLSAPQVHAPSADSLLQSGELDGSDIVLGVDQTGQLVRRTWKQLMSILVLGLMGGGKTNTALWILMQVIRQGYRVALVDRHARSDESTHARLKDFSGAYDTPVGDSPAAAARVVRHVKQVFEDRRQRGLPVSYRLVLVVDEFSATMRAIKDNTSDWQPVAVELAGLLEDLGYEGRKFGVHVICIGQATNASRSGGTEIRDLFHTRIVHGMRARQAQNLGLTDEKEAIQKLETGQVIVDIEGRDDPFQMTVPEVTESFKQAVLSRLAPRRASRYLPEQKAFKTGSLPVQRHTSELINERPVNTVPHTPEPQLPEEAKRVLDLKNGGMGKGAIIWEMWQVRKGGSERYKQADAQYTQIIETLEQLGYLKAQQQG